MPPEFSQQPSLHPLCYYHSCDAAYNPCQLCGCISSCLLMPIPVAKVHKEQKDKDHVCSSFNWEWLTLRFLASAGSTGRLIPFDSRFVYSRGPFIPNISLSEIPLKHISPLFPPISPSPDFIRTRFHPLAYLSPLCQVHSQLERRLL